MVQRPEREMASASLRRLVERLDFLRQTLGQDPHARVSQKLEHVRRFFLKEHYHVDENFQPTLKLTGCLEEFHKEQG